MIADIFVFCSEPPDILGGRFDLVGIKRDILRSRFRSCITTVILRIFDDDAVIALRFQLLAELFKNLLGMAECHAHTADVGILRSASNGIDIVTELLVRIRMTIKIILLGKFLFTLHQLIHLLAVTHGFTAMLTTGTVMFPDAHTLFIVINNKSIPLRCLEGL